MKKTKEQLHDDLVRARRALEAVESAERLAENRKLVGKCFRYRNSYSVPEKSGDYWWLYVKVQSATAYGTKAFMFEVDKYGKFSIHPWEHFTRFDGYTPISASAFNRAWKGVQRRIAAFNHERPV